jgi:hypothetical protein
MGVILLCNTFVKPSIYPRRKELIELLLFFLQHCYWWRRLFFSSRSRADSFYQQDSNGTDGSQKPGESDNLSLCERRHRVLNRDQTEECWKGWMQFIFLLYHYYCREVYNSIES